MNRRLDLPFQFVAMSSSFLHEFASASWLFLMIAGGEGDLGRDSREIVERGDLRNCSGG